MMLCKRRDIIVDFFFQRNDRNKAHKMNFKKGKKKKGYVFLITTRIELSCYFENKTTSNLKRFTLG